MPVDLNESQTPNVLAAIVALGLLGPIFLTLRLIARRKSRAHLWWDDWLIIWATIVLIACAVAGIYGGIWGAGRHIQWVVMNQPDDIVPFLQWIFSAELTYGLVIAPVKCSILMLYIRLFGVQKKLKVWCYVLIGLTIAWFLTTFFGAVFQCDPIERAWSPTGNRENCVDLRGFLVGTNIPNIVIDFLILVTPIHPIWQLKLPTMKKVFITLMLGLGAGEVAFSVVRLIMLTSLATTDITWDYVPAIIWSFTEMTIGVVCACLPTLGPLLPKQALGMGTYAQYGSSVQKTSDTTEINGILESQNGQFSRLDDESANGSFMMDDVHRGAHKSKGLNMIPGAMKPR